MSAEDLLHLIIARIDRMENKLDVLMGRPELEMRFANIETKFNELDAADGQKASKALTFRAMVIAAIAAAAACWEAVRQPWHH